MLTVPLQFANRTVSTECVCRESALRTAHTGSTWYMVDGFTGENCAEKTCPGGDSPCSGRGTCSMGICHCDSSWVGLIRNSNSDVS